MPRFRRALHMGRHSLVAHPPDARSRSRVASGRAAVRSGQPQHHGSATADGSPAKNSTGRSDVHPAATTHWRDFRRLTLIIQQEIALTLYSAGTSFAAYPRSKSRHPWRRCSAYHHGRQWIVREFVESVRALCSKHMLYNVRGWRLVATAPRRDTPCYSASAGLRTPRPPRFSTCVYCIVVCTSAWPSSSCTVRMSVPASRRWVANECRSE